MLPAYRALDSPDIHIGKLIFNLHFQEGGIDIICHSKLVSGISSGAIFSVTLM